MTLDLIIKCAVDLNEQRLMFSAILLESFMLGSSDVTNFVEPIRGVVERIKEDFEITNSLPVIIPCKRKNSKKNSNQAKLALECHCLAAETIISVLEDTGNWQELIQKCAERRDDCLELVAKRLITTGRVQFKAMRLVLQGLIQHTTDEDASDEDIVNFSMLLRGLIIATFGDGELAESAELFRQAVEVTRIMYTKASVQRIRLDNPNCSTQQMNCYGS